MSLQSENWFNPSRGEEVLWYSHPSFIFRLPDLLIGIFVSLFAVGFSFYVLLFLDWPIELVYVLLVFVPVGLGYSLYKMWVFKNTWYVITNRRVITKTGIIGRDSSSKPHREIVRVDIQVSTFDAILSRLTTEDIGDIEIRTADDSGGKFILSRVPEVSLAESYIERLSGTGPDTPAQYDAEERDRLKHEEIQDQQTQGHHQRSGNTTQQNQSEDGFNDQHDEEFSQNNAAQQQNQQGAEHQHSTNTSTQTEVPDSTEQTMDDFEEFEPSDKA